MTHSPKLMIAWTAVASREQAEGMAAEAVARGLAACVQIEGPILSHYRWQGRAERAEEFRLCFKALADGLPALEAFVLGAHPYDTPEWVAVPAARVSEKYLSWARGSANTPTL